MLLTIQLQFQLLQNARGNLRADLATSEAVGSYRLVYLATAQSQSNPLGIHLTTHRVFPTQVAHDLNTPISNEMAKFYDRMSSDSITVSNYYRRKQSEINTFLRTFHLRLYS